jgi:hypothetical protein
MLSYLLAVLAAFGNATSSVLQRKANREVPRNQNLSWRLIWSLLHQPVWFGGILAICIGFLLQATALGFGGRDDGQPRRSAASAVTVGRSQRARALVRLGLRHQREPGPGRGPGPVRPP